MNKRLEQLFNEIQEKCKEENCIEFEYYWEIYDVLWHPWSLEINGIYQFFSFNDISYEDLDKLCEANRIELVKVYAKEEMDLEFDRKRYRLKF